MAIKYGFRKGILYVSIGQGQDIVAITTRRHYNVQGSLEGRYMCNEAQYIILTNIFSMKHSILYYLIIYLLSNRRYSLQ